MGASRDPEREFHMSVFSKALDSFALPYQVLEDGGALLPCLSRHPSQIRGSNDAHELPDL
jgi:hypothetical protein